MIYRAVLIAFAFILFFACKKEQKAKEITTREKLLGTWRRTLRATDYNNNHIIDSAEITHAPATDTLLLSLAPDATYMRTLFFKGEGFPEKGTWHLQSEDAEIVTQPATSTSRVDTFQFDSVSQDFLQYHSAYSGNVWKWEAFRRP